MYTQRFARVAALAALFQAGLLAAPAAASSYWVSIGAFRAPEAAAALATDAASALAIPFSAQAADVPGHGLLHRVLAGPYATRSEALGRAAQIRTAGFKDAWVVAINGIPPVYAPRTPVAPIAADSDLPPTDVLLERLPDAPAAVAAPAEAGDAPAPVGEAPSGYQLNKMRRLAAQSRERASGHWASDFDVRAKWFTTAQYLPVGDAVRLDTGDSKPVGHQADMRLMWRPTFGNWRFLIDHATTWRRDAFGGNSPGLTFDQTALADDRRLWDLTWAPGKDEESDLVYRFDRLALEYRTATRAVTLGRQAVSWGGGLVFQPLDLFNPFAPTTVDQDYKVGDDMLRFEQLFPGGSELQLLAVGRRGFDAEEQARKLGLSLIDVHLMCREAPMACPYERDVDYASLAAKYRMVFSKAEVELMAAHHYDSQVVGLGLRLPVGGLMLRSDVTFTADGDSEYFSGVLNADYSFGIGGAVVHVFGEYYHSGFGVNRLPSDFLFLPEALKKRIERGELFNLMRNYAAVGTSLRWNHAFSQGLSVIGNLHDGSMAAQASLTYDPTDRTRLHLGLTKPIGGRGDEFGAITVDRILGTGGERDSLTIGGGEQAYLRFVYFF